MTRKSKSSHERAVAAAVPVPAMEGKAPARYDNPWKLMIDRRLEDFVLQFFAEAHEQIDWSGPCESLNTNLIQFGHDNEEGGRFADRAFKVRLKQADAALLLIHIEVQGQYDHAFAERMFVYYYRYYDRYRLPLISMALLTDSNPDWTPDCFTNDFGPMRMRMDFPMTKLMDFKDRIDELESSDNPFALVALAHLRHIQLRQSDADLKSAKLAIAKLLFAKNWARDTIRNVFKFLDWVIALSKNLELEFFNDCLSSMNATPMHFIAPFEEILMEQAEQRGLAVGEQRGIAVGEQRGLAKGHKRGFAKGKREGKREGRREGKREALLLILETRQLGDLSQERCRQIVDATLPQLQRWIRRALKASSIEEVFAKS